MIVPILCVLSCVSWTGLGGEEGEGGDREDLPGHMQPLGSHMSPEYVKRLTEVPTPSKFVEQYVRPKQQSYLKDL